jgi:CRP/FNR family transcriptional regulator
MSAVSSASSFPSAQPDGECPNCGFFAWCLPANLELHESKRLNDLVSHQRLIRRDDYLYRAGSSLGILYVICSGFVRTSLSRDDGREQVTGFSMAGELVGMDAIGTGKHICDSVALEDTHVCGIRYADFEGLGRGLPGVQQHFHRMMSAEVTREHGIMFVLGSMRAHERVAVFLLNLSKRFSARGYSAVRFKLPMSRQDIGSYLGLKLETVSREFSHLNDIGIIAINNKNVEIRSLARLQQEIGGHETRR